MEEATGEEFRPCLILLIHYLSKDRDTFLLSSQCPVFFFNYAKIYISFSINLFPSPVSGFEEAPSW